MMQDVACVPAVTFGAAKLEGIADVQRCILTKRLSGIFLL
jgi:hypothetical protein